MPTSPATDPGPTSADPGSTRADLHGAGWGRLAPLFPASLTGSARHQVQAWVVTRLVLFLGWLAAVVFVRTPATQTDVSYYWTNAVRLGTDASQVMIEYPVPVLAVFKLLAWLSVGSKPVFIVAYVLAMVAIDGQFALALWRWGGGRRGDAVALWTLFVLVLGPTLYLRFDLLPSVLAALAVLGLAHRRPGRTGVTLGLGAALKLWPVLLWPALSGWTWRERARSLVAVAVTGGALAVLSLWWGGWTRLISPLVWQRDRGLQVESVPATLAMLDRMVRPGRYDVALSPYKAFEVTGPLSPVLDQLGSAAGNLGYLLIVVVALRWLMLKGRSLAEASVVACVVVVVLIATNKTFSPQYVVWLAAPVAAALAGLGVRDEPPGDPLRRAVALIWQLARWMLPLTLLTVLVYPVGYRFLLHWTPVLGPVSTVVLAARNLLVVYLLLAAIRCAWHILAPTTSRRTP